MFEHITEGCTCNGKVCNDCEKLYCIESFRVFRLHGKEYRRGRCAECLHAFDRARSEKYRAKYPEKWLEWKKKTFGDCIKRVYKMKGFPREEYLRQYRRTPEYREKRRLYQRNRRMQDPLYKAKQDECSRKWRERHPDKVKLYLHRPSRKRYVYPRKAEYRAVYKARRRQQIRNSVIHFTVKEWRTLKAQYNYTCLCCGKQEPEIKLTPDHIQPLSRGGSNSIDNIQPLCFPCNMKKHAKFIDFRPQNP